MLMDLLYETCDTPSKQRVHFHEFMLHVHAQIHELNKEASPNAVHTDVPILESLTTLALSLVLTLALDLSLAVAVTLAPALTPAVALAPALASAPALTLTLALALSPALALALHLPQTSHRKPTRRVMSSHS